MLAKTTATLTRYAIGLGLAALSLTGCTVSPPTLTLSLASRSDLQVIGHYLDSLKAFQADFLQTGDFGGGTGTLWLHRPNGMRLIYAEPSTRTLIVEKGAVVVSDAESGAVTTMPLSKTPLSMLLVPVITLTGNVTVTAYHTQSGKSEVTIQKTDAPGDGSLTLYLTRGPITLTGIMMTDPYGRHLTIQLANLRVA